MDAKQSRSGMTLGGVPFHHPVASWFGTVAATAGVILHLPMYIGARDMGYRARRDAHGYVDDDRDGSYRRRARRQFLRFVTSIGPGERRLRAANSGQGSG